MGYEQMELDVTLSGERELKDNVSLAVEFACRQIAAQNQKVVESNHEGYGIAAEGKVALDSAMKKVSDDMKLFLRILPAGSSEAISAASSLKNSAIEAVKLAANADKIMNDLYKVAQSESTPIEEYLEDQDEEFEEAEKQDPGEAEEMQEENEDE